MAVAIVQFPHPGTEARPSIGASRVPWNVDKSHRRKFLRSPGRTVRENGVASYEGDLAFWGEWEPPSTVEQRWKGERRLPTALHVPCWDKRVPTKGQNTDPWVFGPDFLYSNCKQRTNQGRSVTALQRLDPGSLILFGSVLDGAFVLDTVFVVAERLGEFRPSDYRIDNSKAFDVCTVSALGASDSRCGGKQGGCHGDTYTLFRGATPTKPCEGMFSFVPCRSCDRDDLRFPRPVVELPEINPRNKRAPKGAGNPRSPGDVAEAWHRIVDQVSDEDLELGVDLAVPERCTSSAS